MPGYQPRMTTDPVWINGTNINTYDAGTGLGIRITEIRGWDDTPDVRDVRSSRSGQDGEYADNVYLSGRTITVSGTVHGSTWVNLQSRKRSLAALFIPSADEVLFKVPDPATASPTAVYATTGMTGYERASVRTIEPMTFGDMVGSAAMTFQVSVRASDPRIYSDTASSTDSGTTGTAARTATVDQGGTYETPPTLTVTGPTGTGWTVSDGSDLSVAFTGLTLASTETVAIAPLSRTATLTSPYSNWRIREASLESIWMLQETSGTTADNAEGTAARDGTYTGGVTLNQSGHTSGIASVLLDGVNDYVSIPYAAAHAVGSFTFEIWVKHTGAENMIASDGASGFTSGWQLLVQDDGNLDFTLFSGAGAVLVARSPYGAAPTNTWTHVVVTINGTSGTPQIYCNGQRTVNESIGTYGGTFVVSPSTGITLGRRANGAFPFYFAGNMGPAAFYSRCYSAAEVADLYTARTSTVDTSVYSSIVASSSRWANLGTSSTTYTLASDGLNTGSKINVAYRDARL